MSPISVRQPYPAPQTFAHYLFADFQQDPGPAKLFTLAADSGISPEHSAGKGLLPFTKSVGAPLLSFSWDKARVHLMSMDSVTLLTGLAQLPYPDIDPVFFRIGPLALRWYGLMYLLGLAGAYWLIKSRAATKHVSLPPQQLSDLIVYAAFGVFLGGRLGYVLFYNLPFYLDNPLKIFAVWEGGMSFHGGLIGTSIALWLFCKQRGFQVESIADLAAGAAPIGLGFGRMGNFINGELFGRPTDVPWCMVFPEGGPDCRHPSQLYEVGLEGLALFAILTIINRWSTPPGTMFWTFICGYGVARFFVEFFREPDSHLGFIFQWVTMGQLLCIPMIAVGLFMIIRGYRQS